MVWKSILKWSAIGFGGLILLLYIMAIAFSLGIERGIFPATTVQTGDELPEKQYIALRRAKILERNENVKFYYSEGIMDITYGGSILTTRRILGYWTEDKKVEVLAYPIEKIDGITLLEEGEEYLDAEYEITQQGDDENALLLFLPIDEDRHLEMVSALEAQIAKNNSAETNPGE